MNHHFFVIYRAMEPDKVLRVITSLGELHQFESGLIYLQSQLTREVVFSRVRAVLKAEDKLLVVDAQDRVSISWDAAADESELLAEIFCESTN